jgi:hypothetical protein
MIAGLSSACRVRPAARHLMLSPSIPDKPCTFHRCSHCDGIAVTVKRHGAANGSHKILSARICRCSAVVGTIGRRPVQQLHTGDAGYWWSDPPCVCVEPDCPTCLLATGQWYSSNAAHILHRQHDCKLQPTTSFRCLVVPVVSEPVLYPIRCVTHVPPVQLSFNWVD